MALEGPVRSRLTLNEFYYREKTTVLTYVRTNMLISALPINVSPGSKLELLCEARLNFEKKVVENPRYELEEHIHTMPLDQHVIGYYPVGRADWRILIDFVPEAKALIYQRMQGGKVHTLWRLPLRSGKRLVAKGTIALLLSKSAAQPGRRLTKSQATLLKIIQPLAGYDMEGVDGDQCAAFVVGKDGTSTAPHHFEPGQYCPSPKPKPSPSASPRLTGRQAPSSPSTILSWNRAS